MLLSDVCLSRTSGLTREQRGIDTRQTRISTEVAHVRHTRLGHHFQGQKPKVKGQLVAVMS